MVKKKKETKSTRVGSRVAQSICDEFTIGLQNQSEDNEEFETAINMLECKRDEKEYEWLSDVFLPEYPSIHLTEASQWANQYFQSREFVEVLLGSTDALAQKKAAAAKKFINATLNNRSLYHYQKYIRARSINSINKCVFVVCSWKQELRDVEVPVPFTPATSEFDIQQDAGMTQDLGVAPIDNESMLGGAPGSGPEVDMGIGDLGTPAMPDADAIDDMGLAPGMEGAFPSMEEQLGPQTETQSEVVEDRFEYEVLDPRNVACSSEYVYTIQDKEWVTIRSEQTYETLLELKESNGYFNLDKVKELVFDGPSETSKGTTLKDRPVQHIDKESKILDVYERFGKKWAIIDSRDEDGYPEQIRPGYDEQGVPLDKAEYIEVISSSAARGGSPVLIRFQPTPFVTSTLMPFRPLIRGLCYIHPTKDVGLSDGTYAKELQILINDMLNMAIDRGKLSMMPTLKVRRLAWEDNDSIYFEPEHSMIVEDPEDITEFKIDGDLQPAMDLVALGTSRLQQLQSIYPTTMGELPGHSSTTATAVAGAESNTSLRGNYKSLTFENTFLSELYWMMLQMAYSFIRPETAVKIMGDDAEFFDPDADYTYRPVSSNIETEYNKKTLMAEIDQMLGRVATIPNPAIVPIIATLVGKQFELMGLEYEKYAEMIERLMGTPNEGGKEGGGTAEGGKASGDVASNQYGISMSDTEKGVRGM